jgi:hypothetical protein
MLINKSIALTRHAKFFREGDALTVAGTGPDGVGTVATPANAGVLVLPDPADATWIDFDVIEDYEDKIVNEKKTQVRRGIPGTLILDDEITTVQDMETTLTTSRLTPLAIESFYRPTANLGQNDYQFSPLGSPPRRGWLAFIDYDHKNVQTIVGNVFCVLRVTGGMKSGKGELIMPQFTIAWLYSPLNTMAQGTDA